jgi:DNA polymerase III beta subunit, N-terminal domain
MCTFAASPHPTISPARVGIDTKLTVEMVSVSTVAATPPAREAGVTIEAKRFFDIIRSLPDDDIHITLQENNWMFDGTTLRFSREIATAAPDRPMALMLRVEP